LAAERALRLKPAGMFYVGIKGVVEYVGWSDPPLLGSSAPPENWLEETARRTMDTVEQIRAGRIEVKPSNTDKCRYCDFRDTCRVEQPAAIAAVEVA